MKSIAVTGATSMIGVALIKQCIQNNIQVLALIRPGTKRIDRLPVSDLITAINCDLDALNSVQINFTGIDIFYHIGWSYTDKEGRKSPELQERNVQYTLDAVRLAHKLGCKRFVGTGSQAEYGRVKSIIGPQTPVNPETAYGVAKYASGKLSQFECENLGIEHIWIRVFSVYGTNDNEGTLLTTFISKVQANEQMQLTKCEQIWDFLHEDDAGCALFLLGEKGNTGKIYCLGSGIRSSLLSFLETAKNIVNPLYQLSAGTLPYSEQQVMFLCADISSLTKDTGWQPVISFEEGIRKIYEKNQYSNTLL